VIREQVPRQSGSARERAGALHEAGQRLTGQQAAALVGDVAAVTQALVVLDQRYLNVPGWARLTESGRLGWAALATALDVNLGHPDYSVDSTGWRPRTHTLRISPQSGILGVLQAEHDLLVCLKSFPTAMNMRLIVDSQQGVSRRLAILAERTDVPRAEIWRARAATYSVLKQHLRNVGGRIGKGGPAIAEAANATARLRALPANTIVEPRVAAGFQTIFDGLDQRIADIIETGIDRSAYLQRVQVPQLATNSGRLVTPTRERFMPVDQSTNEELVRAVRGLLPRIEPEHATPGPSCTRPGRW
jgi:hypothetical protein